MKIPFVCVSAKSIKNIKNVFTEKAKSIKEVSVWEFYFVCIPKDPTELKWT